MISVWENVTWRERVSGDCWVGGAAEVTDEEEGPRGQKDP